MEFAATSQYLLKQFVNKRYLLYLLIRKYTVYSVDTQFEIYKVILDGRPIKLDQSKVILLRIDGIMKSSSES